MEAQRVKTGEMGEQMDNVIEIAGLVKYYGGFRALDGIDLQVRPGEIFGFIGPNGAGKSTAIRTMMGLLQANSGEIRLFGQDHRDDRLRQRIGFMPSELNYYHGMSAGEFLNYSAAFYSGEFEARKLELIELFQLDSGKKIQDLSLGNRKKLGIIQALLHGPELLIMDEPTTGLDPLMQRRFFSRIREENARGVSTFLSSHTLSDVQRICERIAVIRDGRIIELEEVENLQKKQLKKVSFSGGDWNLIINSPMVVDPKRSNGEVNFHFAGDSNALIKLLKTMNIRDLVIEEAELEEIFMHYYDDKEPSN